MATRKREARRRQPKAATRDILGRNNGRERVPARWAAAYKRLRTLRDRLLWRQGALAQGARDEQPTFSSHMADAGTAEFDRDFSLGVLSSEQDALLEIEEALNRIRRGTYGVCEVTGARIPAARLAAVPWTRFTAAAERELERKGEIRRTRLGARETVGRSTPAETDGAEEPETEAQPS